MLSKACQYAIKASIFIAQQSLEGQTVSVKDIASAISAPEAFTAKILQQLSKADLLQSIRGKQGGFMVTKEHLSKVRIFDIINVIDGNSLFVSCGLGLKECSNENPCPVHEEFKSVRAGIIKMSQKYVLSEIAHKTRLGIFRLKV